MKLSKLALGYIAFIIIVLGACKEDEAIDPAVRTMEITATSAASVMVRGSIDEVGTYNVLDYGVEYNSSQKKSLGNRPTKGSFETEITISTENYNSYFFARAYLTNEKGTVYGESIQVTFPQIKVTNTAPLTGKAGDRITITGSNFSSSPQDNKVLFNDTPATVVESTNSKLVVEVPQNITNTYYYYGIRITVRVGSQYITATETFKVLPTVNDFSPKSGNVGTLVTLTGNNFSGSTFNIMINGSSASINNTTNTSVSFYIPNGIKQEKLKIDFVSNGVTTTLPGEFTILAPEITSFTPKKGIGGSLVTITGKNFMGTTQYYGNEAVKVKLGDISCPVQSANATEIKFSVPKEIAIGTHTLSVTTPVHTINASEQFTLASPKITSLSPTTAMRGTYLTINGENFGSTQYSYETTVLLGTTAVTIYSWTETTIRVYIPTNMTLGTYKVTVNNGGQSATSADSVIITN